MVGTSNQSVPVAWPLIYWCYPHVAKPCDMRLGAKASGTETETRLRISMSHGQCMEKYNLYHIYIYMCIIYIYTGKVKLLKNPSSKVGSNSTNHGAILALLMVIGKNHDQMVWIYDRI